MKQQFFENSKRKVFLERVSKIFNVDRNFAEAICSIQLLKSLRVNRLKVNDTDQIAQQIKNGGVALRKIDWAPDSYFIDQPDHQLSKSEYFIGGQIYLQNASSLIPALFLDPEPGERILDLCAAPGGKTAHIAAISENKAEIWANDLSTSRVQKMKAVFEQFGVEVAQLTNQPAQHFDPGSEVLFDKILLDAQCSGEGMLNLQHPRALRFWSLSRIEKFSALQREMVERAYQLLNPGGTLVYSTCTFAPEENEQIVNGLIKSHPDMAVKPPLFRPEYSMEGLTRWDGKLFEPQLSNALRILPNPYMEGFFVATLTKRA